MITTTMEHLDRYKGMSENLDRALVWLQEGSWKKQTQTGRVVIDGDNVFAGFDRYTTKLAHEGLLETHRTYIDIQVVVEGTEYVEVRDAKGLTVATAYVDDVEFQEVPPSPSHHVILNPGTALILFPEDSHRPGRAMGGEPTEVFKMVVKIKI